MTHVFTRVRIGLLEIGSRAIRFLVADFDRGGNFDPVHINTMMHGIDPTSFNSEDIAMLNHKIDELCLRLGEYSCDRILVYGTELCRIIDREFPNKISKSIKILTQDEEAKGAWATGLLCEKSLNSIHSVTVIDTGNGSTEVVNGVWNNGEIVDLKTVNINFGSQRLLSLYEEGPNEYLSKLISIMEPIKADIKSSGIDAGDSGRVYFGGGVATKIGWLSVRRNKSDNYNPSRVNGASLAVGNLIDVFKTIGKLYEDNPKRAIEFVDPRKGSEDETARVVACSPYFAFIRNAINIKTDLYITGYGLRHGIAFLMVNDFI